MRWLKYSLFLFVVFFLVNLSLFPQIKIITPSSSVPDYLQSLAQPGDILLLGKESFVLFAGTSRFPLSYTNYPTLNAQGSIIGFGLLSLSQPGRVNIGAPLLRLNNKPVWLTYQSIKPVSTPSPFLQVTAMAQVQYKSGVKGKVETSYKFSLEDNRIDIISTVTNTGHTSWPQTSYALYCHPLTSYRFSPYSPEEHPKLNFIVFPRNNYYLAWVTKSSPQPQTLAPGASQTVTYSLIVASDPASLLQEIYQLLGQKFTPFSIQLATNQTHPLELIIRHALSGQTFFRSFIESTQTQDLNLPLPSGSYLAEINWFPATTKHYFRVNDTSSEPLECRPPRLGQVIVFLQDQSGRPLPGKVTVHGLSPTPSPYFLPQNPRQTGRGWETFKNSCFPPPEGLSLNLPPGGYLLTASYGPEYTIDSNVIEVLAETSTTINFILKKAVNSSGWISIDPHLHTLFSDGRVDIEERLRSVVAEGLQVAIATDHNFITDYRPALNRLGWKNQLFVISGNEITHGGLIHFNHYPLTPNSKLPLNGAIDATKNKVPELFSASRSLAPQGIIQVNHPRSGSIGYFNTHHVDPKTGETANAAFDLSFDVMEGMNGPFPRPTNAQVIKDWLNFLNKGYYFPLVGSSDSHTIDGGEPGYSRTYVAYQGPPFPHLDLQALLDNLKKGHSFITNGPFISLIVEERARPGDLITDQDGHVKIEANVQKAPWVSIDKITIIANGQKISEAPLEFPKENCSLEYTAHLDIAQDTYLVVEITGSQSLFPVVQSLSRSGQAEGAALAYALTNPVFIDFNGNSHFDPPQPGPLKKISRSPMKKNKEGEN